MSNLLHVITLATLATVSALRMPLGRRGALVLGGTAAAASSSPAFAKDSVETINKRRAAVGLPPLEVPPCDGSWAEHTGAFSDSFFDSFTKQKAKDGEETGLFFKFVEQAEGDRPVQGQQVTVYYTGYLEDGTKFDSAYDKGRPFQFRLGKQTVISGWDAVVGGMKVGQKVICRIPPRYGYGDKQVGPIPPNSNLIFYIELAALGNAI